MMLQKIKNLRILDKKKAIKEEGKCVFKAFFSFVISIIVIQTVGVVHGNYIIIKKRFTHVLTEILTLLPGIELIQVDILPFLVGSAIYLKVQKKKFKVRFSNWQKVIQLNETKLFNTRNYASYRVLS